MTHFVRVTRGEILGGLCHPTDDMLVAVYGKTDVSGVFVEIERGKDQHGILLSDALHQPQRGLTGVVLLLTLFGFLDQHDVLLAEDIRAGVLSRDTVSGEPGVKRALDVLEAFDSHQ